MKNIKFLILCITFIIIESCVKLDSPCFHSRGKTTSKIVELPLFYEVSINGIFDVYWHNDNQHKIMLTGGENNISFIDYKVINKTLIISDDNKCKWLRKYEKIRIDIYCPHLTKISLHKSNNFYCLDTIITNSLHIDNFNDICDIKILVNLNEISYSQHAGTGNTYIAGKCNSCYIWSHGTGFVNAENLISNFCNVTHKTTGNISVNVKHKLIAYLYKTGNLLVIGKPDELISFSYDKGKLILINQ